MRALLRFPSFVALFLGVSAASPLACNPIFGIEPPAGISPSQDGGPDGAPTATATSLTDGGPPFAGACPPSTAGSSGQLDPTFRSGVTRPGRGGVFDPFGVLVDAQSRIYVFGWGLDCVSPTSGADFEVIRLLENGNLDSSYGEGTGSACADFGTGGDDPLAATFDGAGRLVLAGHAATSDTRATVAVARFTTNGALDRTFAAALPRHGGMADFTPPGAQNAERAYTAFGIVAEGNSLVVAGADANEYLPGSAGFLFRIQENGAFDPTFTPMFDTNVMGYYGLAKSNGAYVVGTTYPVEMLVGAKRFAADGAPDNDFNRAARVGIFDGTPPFARIVVAQADGSVLVGGSTDTKGGGFAMAARFTGSGALDVSGFSAGTFVSQTLIWNPYYNFAGLAIQCDGKVLLGGTSGTTTDTSHVATRIQRLSAGGLLDVTYGDRGIASSPIDSATGAGGAIAVDPTTGKIIAAARRGDRVGAVTYRFLP